MVDVGSETAMRRLGEEAALHDVTTAQNGTIFSRLHFTYSKFYWRYVVLVESYT